MVDRKELKEYIEGGEKGYYQGYKGVVYTIVKHVSRSGLNRLIDCYVIREGIPQNITASVAELLERKADWKCVKCLGMDMEFELVYSVAQALYGDGYQLNHVSL